MTVQLPPELEKQLDEAARQARISKDDLVRDVLRGYLQEAADVRAMLARRYDDLESGRVKAIPTEEGYCADANEGLSLKKSAVKHAFRNPALASFIEMVAWLRS
ncbi:MAG: CopG family transcriptional regulator [Bryobacterales bacterium]